MEAKISTKNQVVIPKLLRKKYGFKPGDKVNFTESKDGKLVIESAKDERAEYIAQLDALKGTLVDTPWQKAGIDAAVWLRRERDTDR